MGNILTEFRKEIGYIDVSNQYIELSSRVFQSNYENADFERLSQSVGLMVSSIPDDLSVRLSRQYIVSIHTCVECFLNEFKSLPGSPTYRKEYDAEKDGSRLKWTVNHCYKVVPTDVKELMRICEYYRLVRNGIVHGELKDSSEMKAIKSSINLSDEMLGTKIYGHLLAPNDFLGINFDDQVLFSRAANRLIEKIYRESKYDWEIVISENKEQIDHIIQTVKDNKAKKEKKIKKYISGIYYLSDTDSLNEIIEKV